MRGTYLLLFIVFLALIQCRTVKSIDDTKTLTTAINGTWQIEHVVCCGRTSAITYGGNKSIKFNTKQQKFILYQGAKAVQKGSYSIKDGEFGTMINLDDKFPAILRITDGKLFIDWSYMDLQREVYSR